MSDVRSLLKQARETRRITHPYAKYTAQGALYCTACTQKIASENLWETHITSTQHKEKVKDAVREGQRKAKRTIAATAMDEEETQLENEESRKRMKIEDPPEVVEADVTEDATDEGLPTDFFDEGSKPVTVGVDEDEWAKFQEEIKETIRNQEEGVLEDEEEMRRGIEEEFDELNTLEDRVERLKKRRAELQKSVKDTKPVVTKQAAGVDEDDDSDVEEEEWW
jgi:zinc finger protein 830